MLAWSVNNCFSSVSYIINDYIIIDPGDKRLNFSDIEVVLLTHAHFDHIYGLNELLLLSPRAKVYTNAEGKEMLLNAKKNLSFYHEKPFVFEHPECIVTVKDNEEIYVRNNIIAKAVYTPGHNPSCISWIIGNFIFTGDSYIPGIKTVTNLPGGNQRQAINSIELIKRHSLGRTIYPGHKL